MLKPTQKRIAWLAGIGWKVLYRSLRTSKCPNSKRLYCGGKISFMSLCTEIGFAVSLPYGFTYRFSYLPTAHWPLARTVIINLASGFFVSSVESNSGSCIVGRRETDSLTPRCNPYTACNPCHSGLDQIHCAFCWQRPGLKSFTIQ
jgi:hypothetical protein